MEFVFNAIGRIKRREPSEAQRNVDAEVHQLVELLREAASGGVAEGLGAALQNLADHGPDIERGVVAWIELMEVLVQAAEQRYPNGNGARKKGQVRAAVHAIYNDSNLQLPGVPRDLSPLVINITIDWVIDALVQSVDTYGLWDSSRPDHWSLDGALRAAGAAVLDALQPFFRFLNWIYAKLHYVEPLTPEVKAAVQRVKDAGLIYDKRTLIKPATDVIVFIGQHGEQMTAGVKAFFEVVAMTERLRSASGPEKKVYASQVVKAALKELGFPIDNILLGAIADVVISAGIESALNLFKKRAPKTFQSRSALPVGALHRSYVKA